MKKITMVKPTINPFQKRKRVAAYARVSKETERLSQSLSAQVSYYSELIQSNPEWEYVGVYADRFITGTLTTKRAEFQRLIKDCDDGKIDIILCKSISRFARNTVDLLETVRHLKDNGIEVRFEKERINSLSEDGELMLTLLASFAQEESVSISENCKWGIRRTYQNGTDGVRQKRLFGYRYDGEKYVIVPDEAEAVKYIYKRYLEGAGYKTISDELAAKNVRSWRGFVMPMYSIKYILSNEIYVGDRLLQKVYIKDPIKKIKVKNRGELPQYLIQNCHEPIIDRETFDAVQAEHKKRVDGINITAFTKKIKCAVCGRYYTRKINYVRQWSYVDWHCRSKKEGGNCDSGYLKEERLKTITTKLLGWDEFDGDKFDEQVQVIIADKEGNLVFRLYDGSEIEWRDMLQSRNDGIDRKECFKDKIFCGCCGVVYHRTNSANKWITWYCAAKKRTATMNDKHSINYNESDLARIAAYILGTEMLDEAIFEEQVQSIVVLENGDLQFNFRDGSTKLWERM